MTWKRIEVIGEPELTECQGGYEVDYELAPEPSDEWEALFNDKFSGTISSAVPRPRVSGGVVSGRVSQDMAKAFADAVRERVKVTNDRYEKEVIPAQTAARHQREASEKARVDRENEMRRKLSGG